MKRKSILQRLDSPWPLLISMVLTTGFVLITMVIWINQQAASPPAPPVVQPNPPTVETTRP